MEDASLPYTDFDRLQQEREDIVTRTTSYLIRESDFPLPYADLIAMAGDDNLFSNALTRAGESMGSGLTGDRSKQLFDEIMLLKRAQAMTEKTLAEAALEQLDRSLSAKNALRNSSQI